MAHNAQFRLLFLVIQGASSDQYDSGERHLMPFHNAFGLLAFAANITIYISLARHMPSLQIAAQSKFRAFHWWND